MRPLAFPNRSAFQPLRSRGWPIWIIALLAPGTALAADGGNAQADLAWRVLLLVDYNTRVVVIGTTLLGAAAGLIGTFAYLRKRALMGDALGHATLPGVAAAFCLMGTKNLPAMLLGAAVTGVLGILCVMGLRRATRLKEDAAIGIVLSVFFAFGLVLLSVIQQMNTGNEAGMQAFIYGKAAAMIRQDALYIAVVAALVTACVILLFKEFRVVCFDASFAAVQGWPVHLIDLIMMALVVLTVVIGLQAVGLILIVALLIIPAAAARFWTDHLTAMTVLAALFGAISGWIGAAISALAPRMPTGAIIVVVAGVLFAVSMLLAPRRGFIATVARHGWLRRKVAYQHLLRALAEIEEEQGEAPRIDERQLLPRRSWHLHALRRLVRRAIRRGHLGLRPDGILTLTEPGRTVARRCLRNHRLWEMYLIRYADIAPSHVDRDADEVEHLLSEPVIRELDEALQTRGTIPPCPHTPASWQPPEPGFAS